MVRHNRLSVLVNNFTMGGDPALGQPKDLTVMYEYQGQRRNTNTREGNNLTLFPEERRLRAWLGHETEEIIRPPSASHCTSINSVLISFNELQRRHNCKNTPDGSFWDASWFRFGMAFSGVPGNERSFVVACSLRNIRPV